MSAPVVTLVSPATGMLGRFDPITVDVTDDQRLALHLLCALFADPLTGRTRAELVVDGGDLTFVTGYQVTRSVITDGYRYTFTRRGGWPWVRGTGPLHPTILARAVDDLGGSAT